MAANQATNATLLLRGGDGYPESLDQFDDAPAILTVKGNQHFLSRPNIAIVGARNASFNALQNAKILASELAQEGIVITFGMERGFNATAHNDTLAGGTTKVIAGAIESYHQRKIQNYSR